MIATVAPAHPVFLSLAERRPLALRRTMGASSVLSDDDYDVISNPGTASLENSVILDKTVYEVHELPAFDDAQDNFETTRWSAAEIQAYVRKGLNLVPENKYENRRVTVYVDGSFNMFDVGGR